MDFNFSIMRYILSFFVILIFCSCRSYILNKGLSYYGVYDDKVTLEGMHHPDQTLIFIPMHHIGTKPFYDDLKFKVDSLKGQGYFFFTEGVFTANTSDTNFRKFRKFMGTPLALNGYKMIMDSLMSNTNFKFKQEIIDQPTTEALGLKEEESRQVDTSLDQMIKLYENEYGEILLEPCDFETPLDKKSNCKKLKIDKGSWRNIVLDHRNQIIVEELLKNHHNYNKVAIIYGANHFEGIREALLTHGYQNTF
jgi:hypothetical protein